MTIERLQRRFAHLPTRDIDLLLSFALRQPKEFIFAHPSHHLTTGDFFRFYCALWRYQHGWPLAYIHGHKEFYGLDFYVNKNVLIPRPETELMIDEVRKCLETLTHKHPILIDVGTGSGCIPIVLSQKTTPGSVAIYASDLSKKALRVAKKNALYHNALITFLEGNLLEPFVACMRTKPLEEHTQPLIITANLPYLTQAEFTHEPSIQKEPVRALISDNKDGLDLYRNLAQQIKALLSKHFSPLHIFLEINPHQTNALTDFLRKEFSTAHVRCLKDLAQKERLIVLDIIS